MSTIRGVENKHDRALIHDDFSAGLLLKILTELKKITAHLALLNNEEIKDEDLDNAN
jgi:hypothetical protein